MLSWIPNIPVGTKLRIAFGLLVAIIIGFAGTYFSQTSDSIEFSQKEVYGNDYVTAVRPLLKFIPQHRGTTNAVMNGNSALAERLPGLRQSVQQAFADLKAFDSEQAEVLKIGNRVEQLEARWAELARGHQGKTAPNVFAAHTDLIADIRGLISYVGDTSNLILDPELDSFYLMDNIIVKSPGLGEYAGQARGLGAGIVARGMLTAEEQNRLLVLSVRLRDAFSGSMQSLLTAGDNNPAVADQLKASVDQLQAAGSQGQALIDRILQRDFAGMSSASYFDAMTAVIAANGQAVEKSAELLDGLLNIRIDNMKSSLYTTLIIVAILVVGAAAFTLIQLGFMNRLLARANGYFEEIQNGNLTIDIESPGTSDAFGQLFAGLEGMKTQLNETRIREQAELAANSRIKQGLDSVNTSTMIADADGQIIYLNDAAQTLMRTSHDNLRTVLPNFDQAQVLGSNFDIFHANPAHQRGLLTNLKGTHKTEIKVGSQIFSLTANPVFGEDDERLGTIVEWAEKTDERRIEDEIGAVVQSAANGDLSARIAEHDKSGFFLSLAKGINGMAESAESIIGDTSDVMASMADGDLTKRITKQYRGQFGELASSVNRTIAQMTSTIEQILQSSEQIRAGAEEIAQGNSDLSHRTEEQASSLEETASSMEEMTGLVRQTAENARNVNELAGRCATMLRRAGKWSKKPFKRWVRSVNRPNRSAISLR